MSAGPIGDYQPGDTVLHRSPVGPKLFALVVLSVVAVAFRSVSTTAGLLVLAVVVCAVAGVRVGRAARALRGIAIGMALLAGYQTWQRGAEHAFVVVGAFVALLLMATAFTTTTSVDRLVDTLTRWLEPTRRFGVRPELVALAFSLMIRGIPLTLQIAAETRDAARARGLERSPRAYLTPMVIRVVAHARATGDALHARGIGDD
ncbi:energy-coupling factor transporter transmembrane protein EcfT [Nocardioides sp. zg-ZUI104]|uniref:energy-coupling factor transporter transmembrane component T n=1 Tax=Nocardioides faecalis TaxID=2803858 RepID=UPI001BCE0A02|nr:energy-coupling factor transporter transmembrane component T [Nocardioides faecalis]MBS4751457.1 energy-coupling factor transporter transmembrane protein EcfT [Nocardioides faecalis]